MGSRNPGSGGKALSRTRHAPLPSIKHPHERIRLKKLNFVIVNGSPPMSWKNRCLSFVKKYGKAAKVVAGAVLNVVAPGSGALVGLVEFACDKANDTAQD